MLLPRGRRRHGWSPAVTRDEEITQACRLHRLGLSYTAIAVVMAEYHGAWCVPDTWRWRLRRHGLVEGRPRGIALRNKDVA